MGFKTKTFLNNNPPALEDVDLNGYKSEFNNSFTAAGLSPSDGDLQQTAKSMSIHAAGADFYTDSGAADAYVLSPSGSFLAPEAYFTGMRVRFIPTNSSTAASTINVASLGVKNIKRLDGSDTVSSSLISGEYSEIYYDGTDFRILNEKSIYETKTLSANQTVDGTMSDLSYTLTVGRTYRIYANFVMTTGDTGSVGLEVQAIDNVTSFAKAVLAIGTNAETVTTNQTIIIEHTMGSTDLHFDLAGGGSGDSVIGSGTTLDTFVTVRDITDSQVAGTVS